MSTAGNELIVSSYAHAPTRTVSASGVTYAYRELGPKGGTPVIFFVHLAALGAWELAVGHVTAGILMAISVELVLALALGHAGRERADALDSRRRA